jgi:sugar phosphate isomerase/epimerase
MNYKLACADFTFPLLGHEHSLDLISMMGFDGVDIGLFEGRSHLYPSAELNDPAQSGQAMLRKVADRGLKVADVFLQMDPDFTLYAVNHPEQQRRAKARDWFQRTLDYAAACESPHVTALPGVSFDAVSGADALGLCHDELAWRVEQAQAGGLVFGVEAHVGSIVPTPEEALALVESVRDLTLTLDYTHFALRGLPDANVEPLIAHASHFHARGAREGRLQSSFENNVIDYRRIVEVMDSTGYDGCIGIEYVWIDWEHCNEVDNLSETIRFRNFFRSLFAANNAD